MNSHRIEVHRLNEYLLSHNFFQGPKIFQATKGPTKPNKLFGQELKRLHSKQLERQNIHQVLQIK